MATDEEIARLLAEGVSARAASRETGASRDRVHRIRDERGIATYTPSIPEHGTNPRYQRGCRCDDCAEAHARVNAADHRKNPRRTTTTAFPSETTARIVEKHRADQAVTVERATRRRVPWTATEHQIVMDYTHSATEAALILGRTRHAVIRYRAKHQAAATASGPMPRGKRASKDHD